MSCQLEVLQTCVSTFMMGLINHKSIPKKLMKKCKIFDYLCKKFPLDLTQLENYSKSIAFNSTLEVEKKFIQNNMLDLLVFNKCISMDSSAIQLSNSVSTTVLDSSAECISPYIIKMKNNLLTNNNNLSIKDVFSTNVKSITNFEDQSCSSSGSLQFPSTGQLNSTTPVATVQYTQKMETLSNPPFVPQQVNTNYGIGSLQVSKNNSDNATSIKAETKNQPALTNIQSPSLNMNINTYQIQSQRFQTMQTPSINTTVTTNIKKIALNQENIKINQFNEISDKKANNVANNSTSSASSSSNQNNSSNNNIHLNTKQANNNFYYPMCIKPINFKMTMSNNLEFNSTQNTFDNSSMNNGNSSNNYLHNQQFNNTLYKIQQQDLMLKSCNNNNNTAEKVNNFNPTSLLSKIQETISTFKENTDKIQTLIQSSNVTESHISPFMLTSRGQPTQNIMLNNKPTVQQTPSIKGIQIHKADHKRKTYMLKNMSIYQQNNMTFRKLQV